MRYLWGGIVLPLALLLWLNAGAWWVYLIGGGTIYFLGSVAFAVLPLDVAPYDSHVP